MVVTVFRAYARKSLDPQLLPQIEARAARMLELASKMPGFISYKEFQAADGETLSIVEFDTVEHVRAWHDDPEHREVQQWGRDRVFERYDIKTREVVRTLRFPRARVK
jgi:heme-degrading monooxygenase HmoA